MSTRDNVKTDRGVDEKRDTKFDTQITEGGMEGCARCAFIRFFFCKMLSPPVNNKRKRL